MESAPFFCFCDKHKEDEMYFDRGELRHIEKVLRLRPGEIVAVFDGSGMEYRVRLREDQEQRLKGEIISKACIDREPETSLHLVQGIAKGDKMDSIVQKAVEIGVKAIHPLAAQRSVVELDERKAGKRVMRWQEIAREACKQCRRNQMPLVNPMRGINEILQIIGQTPAIMLYEEEHKLGLKQLLQTEEERFTGQEIFILVGPEGGFSHEEAEAARDRGVHLVTLGPRILRTETAGLVAASLILYHFNDLG
ncbi:16S rRNA (uracil(1498)-N(3))-methyltransferase [Syntrophomonas palmitatica]|uniref:16S rRNA (uracil(1498)-N(3))-methyltransferase n=1 Tax=Syntrophomonas palmitatica TaxID=402877 RepID=UPI0006D0C220|nr:16S rRNA (uracil(1498)-N(3))-methyltransferase [Syntrophomonas palmitatica]